MKPDGGPAFPMRPERVEPVSATMDMVTPGEWPGMTLLDYFAAAAMPIVAIGLRDTPCPTGMTLGQHAAQIAYAIAARMIQERAK